MICHQTYYSFRANGRTSKGIRVSCAGHVYGESTNEHGLAPLSVMKAAREVILAQLPTFRFAVESRPNVTGYPTMRALKRVPASLRGKTHSLSFPARP